MANPAPLCYNAATYSAMRSIFMSFPEYTMIRRSEFKQYKGIYRLFLAGSLQLWQRRESYPMG